MALYCSVLKANCFFTSLDYYAMKYLNHVGLFRFQYAVEYFADVTYTTQKHEEQKMSRAKKCQYESILIYISTLSTLLKKCTYAHV